jgi:N-hydroxyarylamine O-acetyltransferase
MSVQYWGTPDALSAEQVVHYLERLGLDAQATLARPADYALLAEVQLAQVLRVPFDTSSIHLPLDPSDKVAMAKPFAAMGGYGMAMDVQSTYENVVERGRGGYCFAVNMLLAALFRALGFRVSAVASRGYRRGHQDPGKGGYIWGPIVHVREKIIALAFLPLRYPLVVLSAR